MSTCLDFDHGSYSLWRDQKCWGADAVAGPVGGLSASIAPEVNAFRVANGLPALAPDGRLVRVVQAHAIDMQGKAYFSHTGQDGSSAGSRLKRQEYGF